MQKGRSFVAETTVPSTSLETDLVPELPEIVPELPEISQELSEINQVNEMQVVFTES